MVNFGKKKFAETKYGGKDYYVVDCFEYKGRKYYFIINKIAMQDEANERFDDFNNMLKSNFIYKIYDVYFNNVSDDKLFKELFNVEEKRNLLRSKKVAQ